MDLKCPVPIVGLHKRDLLQLEEAKLLHKELDYLNQECKDLSMDLGVSIQRRFSTFWGKVLLWVYKAYLCGLTSTDAKMKSLEARQRNLDVEIKELSKEPQNDSTGLAFIIFNYVQVSLSCSKSLVSNCLHRRG